MGTKSVRNSRFTWRQIALCAVAGAVLFFGNGFLLHTADSLAALSLYIVTLAGGYLCLMTAGIWVGRLLSRRLDEDPFNTENESFLQEERLLTNEYSVNLPTSYYYRRQWRRGYINIVNPFRSVAVVGGPGSGKSFSVINNFIKQQIEKGYAMFIYDFKFPDLSTIAYNHLRAHHGAYTVPPRFCVLNFDDPRRSHRCNPLTPELMVSIADAYEASYTLLLNLNRTWVTKQGEFFTESAITLLTAIFWFLKIYKGGRYCTFPHALELINKRYNDVFLILMSYPELENYMSPFVNALRGGAMDQLMGQVASVQIPISRLISPELYWIMSGDDFTLDINDPVAPKILAIGNNPDRISIYGSVIGLYTSRLTRLINQKGKLKSSIILDELPTVYMRNLDVLMATCRSNLVSVVLGIQDFSQLVRDYGDKEAKVIINTVGNILAGQCTGESAKTLSERFGKILQQRQSQSVTPEQVSHSISTQMDSLIPPSKISTLSQGEFVGAVADNAGEKIDQKIFHGRIVVDMERVKREEAAYVPIPEITSFRDDEGHDRMEEIVRQNYDRIRAEVDRLMEEELDRIKRDPRLSHLMGGNK